MALCPGCEEDIEVLEAVQTRVTGFRLVDGKPEYDDALIDNPEVEQEWTCPKCGWSLRVSDEEEAVQFLNGDLVFEPRPKYVYEPLPGYSRKKKTDQMELALE